MLSYKLKIVGPNISKIKDVTTQLQQNVEKGMAEIGKRVEDQMTVFVRLGINRTGSTGNLQNSISHRLMKDKNNIFVGVGDVEKMFREAPYWFVANYGARWPGSIEGAIAGQT